MVYIIDLLKNASSVSERVLVLTVTITAINVIITFLLTITNLYFTERRIRTERKINANCKYYLPIYLRLIELQQSVLVFAIDTPETEKIALKILRCPSIDDNERDNFFKKSDDYLTCYDKTIQIFHRNIDKKLFYLYRALIEIKTAKDYASDKTLISKICATPLNVKYISKLIRQIERTVYYRPVRRLFRYLFCYISENVTRIKNSVKKRKTSKTKDIY